MDVKFYQMNYIQKRAEKFVLNNVKSEKPDYKEVISKAKLELLNIDSSIDKLTFLKIILETNARKLEEHLPTCSDKSSCQIDYSRESITYYLTQELNRLGIRTNNDQFTFEEKKIIESKLSELLTDIKGLKDGQQIIYDDLLEEIESLKELFILGKRNWFQLLVGKASEMVAGGIISETVSKEIIKAIGEVFSNAFKLLNKA